jgi:BASS family bile acid:Na+ symporter
MDTPIDQLRINFDNEALWTMNLALALVMFGIALEIKPSDFRQILRSPKSVLTGVCCQFFLLPALTFLLIWWWQPQPSFALGMILVASCPGGNVSNFMSHLSGGNTALSVSLTAIATLLAVVMTPLNLQFWGSLYEPSATMLADVHINLLEMVQLVALLLGLPLIAGMLLGNWKPNIAMRLAKVFKVVSLLFFVFLIFVALYNNRDIFLDYVGLVFLLVFFHNMAAFLLGYTSGRVMKLPFRDVKSITIETGIQNSGLGLLLIFTFFEGLGGMALLAAFWGIWHLVSGLALSALWGGIPVRKESVL